MSPHLLLFLQIFSIKFAIEVNKEFFTEAKMKQVILEIVIIDEVNKVDQSDGIDKYKGITLS